MDQKERKILFMIVMNLCFKFMETLIQHHGIYHDIYIYIITIPIYVYNYYV